MFEVSLVRDQLSLQLSQRNLLAEDTSPFSHPLQTRLAFHIADVYRVEPLSAQNNCPTELFPCLSLPFGIIHFYITPFISFVSVNVLPFPLSS
jgi:hypothetical protein